MFAELDRFLWWRILMILGVLLVIMVFTLSVDNLGQILLKYGRERKT